MCVCVRVHARACCHVVPREAGKQMRRPTPRLPRLALCAARLCLVCCRLLYRPAVHPVLQGLQTYERDGWGEYPTDIIPERREIRPTADRGPILLCVDTSGSMRGPRETVAKASLHLPAKQPGCESAVLPGPHGASDGGLVQLLLPAVRSTILASLPILCRCAPWLDPQALALECMRAARQQERNCYVFAFAGLSEVRRRPPWRASACVGVWVGGGRGCKKGTNTTLPLSCPLPLPTPPSCKLSHALQHLHLPPYPYRHLHPPNRCASCSSTWTRPASTTCCSS